ncbi:MAG: hypothetical protein VB084_13430 [Syntrophomonadaceae bacterium]|nr:hypothetical protein [Syntrophomonadaceae bacterium]
MEDNVSFSIAKVVTSIVGLILTLLYIFGFFALQAPIYHIFGFIPFSAIDYLVSGIKPTSIFVLLFLFYAFVYQTKLCKMVQSENQELLNNQDQNISFPVIKLFFNGKKGVINSIAFLIISLLLVF